MRTHHKIINGDSRRMTELNDNIGVLQNEPICLANYFFVPQKWISTSIPNAS